MTSDELYEDVPNDRDENMTDVHRDPTVSVPGGDRPATDFPERWDSEPDDTAAAAGEFGERWSNEPEDDSAERAQEFGERWAEGSDDSAERAESFGAVWSGETQAGAGS